VLLIQENRSFDNLFNGYPGANTKSVGKAVPVPNCLATPVPGTTPTSIPLQPVGFEAKYDMSHGRDNWVVNYDNGKMDGFNQNCPTSPQPNQYPQYAYVPQSETAPYWAMASQYVLADNMFQSNIDGSFVAHQYLIAAQANREVDYPDGEWNCSQAGVTVFQLAPDPNPSHNFATSPPVPVCQDYQALSDELPKLHLTWKVYASTFANDIQSDWNGFAAIKHIYKDPSWKTHFLNNTNFVSDIAAGKLATITWLLPTMTNSDHPDSMSTSGPSWVASAVNAIGTSKFWPNTVIFVVWDDWGGWYDHVKPKYVDFDGLGFRVPLLMISAYTPKGVIAHKELEFGSILRYIENNFGLAPLAASDTRATPVDQGCKPSAPCINYNQTPRPFQTIAAPLDAQYFLHQPPDGRPLDTQ